LKNKKLLRMFALAMLVISFSGFLSGCWDSHELNKLAIVSGVGFDIDPATGEHLVTYQTIIPSKVKGSTASSSGEQTGGGISPAVQLDHIKGNTWSEPLGTYATQENRSLFFPHTQVDILGMEVAKQGVYPLIEQILRLVESRPNRLLLVAQDKASAILEARDGMEVIPAMGIAGEVKLSAEFSKYPTVTILEFANRLMSKTTAPILPIISIFEETGPDGKKVNKVRITGTAVFKGDKMVGELNEQESRGMLWVIDKIKKGFVVVDAPDGSGKASLSISRAKSKIQPELTDGKITINIVIEEQSDLTEYNGSRNLDDILLKQIEESQAEAIKKEVMAALNRSFALNADVFGFGEAVHRKYKKDWPDLEARWDEIYPSIDVAIKVKTHVNETGDISKAVIPQ
jgi:spore germination protein KC